MDQTARQSKVRDLRTIRGGFWTITTLTKLQWPFISNGNQLLSKQKRFQEQMNIVSPSIQRLEALKLEQANLFSSRHQQLLEDNSTIVPYNFPGPRFVAAQDRSNRIALFTHAREISISLNMDSQYKILVNSNSHHDPPDAKFVVEILTNGIVTILYIILEHDASHTERNNL